ncbi:alanine racemase [Novosphingobium sp. Chol11]|uniref:alanine racemase n=1 Tax=Novosphingobium sp. Chol11 TaxID=1385763 RepID=UPI0025F053CB|nr:alanine racemase [Novosphingobium sp. Chol11]
MRRRDVLAGGALLAGWGIAGARAAPMLSAGNFGLTAAKAARRNGWIEVDAAAFEANMAALRGMMGPARLCAVMKADAYGNGIALLIPSIIKLGIRDVAITSNDEAQVARALGYRGRLLRIRTATPDEMEDALPFALEELIGNPDAAARLAQMAARRGRPTKVHLALNAGGMSRNGVELSTPYGQADARAMLAMKALRIVGVMTHYPSEESADILGQLAQFNADVAWLSGQGLDPTGITRHTANTFAALSQPATRLDMVRIGGAIYGDPGSFKTSAFALVPAIKARVAAVNHYPAGQTVNYDRTFRLARESWLANIPIGYSDGIRRGFSHANRPEFPAETKNDSAVLIGGQRFPIVGRVTMNTLMADVTGSQGKVGLGDEVVLLGVQGSQRITQADFEAGSSAYAPEMLTMLGATMPKVLRPAR